MDSTSRRSLREIFQQGTRSTGPSLREPAATSKPTVEVSAKDREEPVVRNLPEIKLKTPVLEVSSAETSLQGASIFSVLLQQEKELGHLLSGAGGLRLATRNCLDPLGVNRERQEQRGNVGTPKPGGSTIENIKRTSLGVSSPTDTERSSKRPRESSGPGIFKEALTNIKIAIFRKTLGR
jgi:hypothetical protein